MKITIFISSLSGGGAERVVSNLSNHLLKKHQVTIVTMADDPPAYFLESGIEKISLNKGKSPNFLVKNVRRFFNLRKFVKTSEQDLYVVFLRIPSFLLLFFKHLIDAPVVVSERADPSKYFDHSPIKKLVMNYLYPKADGFVFQTKDAKDYYKDVIKDNAVVIPNAINKEFAGERYYGPRKEKIVAAGRFTDQKNFPLLLRSFSKVSDTHPNFHLEIFGDGPDKNKLITLTKELGIETKVAFPGYVDDLGRELRDASLFVLSSDYEGMPNALMEAMALGVPCISTDCPVGGPRYLIKDGSNGLLVPVNDEEALTKAMNKVLSSPSLANALGENAKEIIQTLNAEKIYGNWEKYLTQVVKSHS